MSLLKLEDDAGLESAGLAFGAPKKDVMLPFDLDFLGSTEGAERWFALRLRPVGLTMVIECCRG